MKHILSGSLLLLLIVTGAARRYESWSIFWIGAVFVVFDAVVISPKLLKYYKGYLHSERCVDRHKRLGIKTGVANE